MNGHTHLHESDFNKYEQALSKYNLKISDESIKTAVEKLIA